MAGARRIEIQFLGRDVSAGKTANDVEGKYGKLGGRMNAVGKVAGRALAGGLLLAGAAAVKSGKAAAEDEAAQSKLANTLTHAAHATKGQIAETESWITTMGKQYGVADDDLRPALARLATATHDVGQAQQLARLAMDISAGSGKSLEQVTTALQKAQNGSVGGLARLGVATKDAQGHTKSLDDITKDLASTYSGAAAKAADTTAGKQKILAVQFQELQETIGAKLLPVMQKLTEVALGAIDWMTKHQTLIKGIAAVVVPLVAGLYAVVKVTQAYTAVQAALNVVMTANPIGLVVAALAALAIGLFVAYKKSETFRDTVNGVFSAVKTGASLMWGALKGYFRFIVDAWLTVAGAIIHGAANAFGWVPKIGDKLEAAANNFDDFRDQVNAALDGTKDKKSIKFSTPGAKETINSLTTIGNLVASLGDKLAVQVGPPKAKHRAGGGPVRAGQPYIVGENRPELFVPGTSGRIVPRVPAQSASTSGAPQTYVVDLRLDGRTIQTILLKEKRRTGGMALGLA